MQVAMGMTYVNEADLQFAKQIGVTHLVARPEYDLEDGHYRFERLLQLRTRVEAAGLKVVAVHDVPSEWNDKVRLGLPGRDEQLDNYCRTLSNMGRAGIPILGYSFHADKVWRTSRHTRGRGGALFTSYDHALMADAPLIGPMTTDDAARWAQFEYFIKRVMPVAESAGVKMALHPDDPPISPIAGAASIFRDVQAFQRALDMVPSPSNGLLFCQGCYTELLGQGVFEAIRHFGGQGKVFYIHYRNVVGSLPKFREAFVDNGDIDMFKAMKLWKDVGFDGPMMPDHYAHMVGDTAYGHRARAHGVGYMKAMMTVVGAL
jgi:mannonate dehydratase